MVSGFRGFTAVWFALGANATPTFDEENRRGPALRPGTSFLANPEPAFVWWAPMPSDHLYGGNTRGFDARVMRRVTIL
jgi:hypothetical protein